MKTTVFEIKEFCEKRIRVIRNDSNDQTIFFTGEEIGFALELEEPKKAIYKIYQRHQDELEAFSILWVMETPGGPQEVRIFAEEAVYMITFFSQSPKAKEFRRWVAGLIKAYRLGNLGSGPAGRNHLAAMREQRLFMKEQRAFQQYAKEEAGRIIRKEGTIDELDQVPIVQEAVRKILEKDPGVRQLGLFHNTNGADVEF